MSRYLTSLHPKMNADYITPYTNTGTKSYGHSSKEMGCLDNLASDDQTIFDQKCSHF